MVEGLVEMLEVLKKIDYKLNLLTVKEEMPKLLYVKDIVANYRVNSNKAAELCKKYGTNFGGYCIEVGKFKEVLQTKGTKLFD